MKLYGRLLLFALSFLMYSCYETKFSPTPIGKVFPTILHDSLIVDGYFQKFSFNQNDSLHIRLNAKRIHDSAFLGIYDINDKLVDFIHCKIRPQQMSMNLPYMNGYNYEVSAHYQIPTTLKSGMYFLAKKLPFIVKNSSNPKNKIVVVHPSNTDIAYNNSGGMSLYYPSHQIRARVLSTLRPWIFPENGPSIAFYKWLENSNYKVDYICDADMEDSRNIDGYDAIIIAGHSEYWTRTARLNFDSFVDNHHNALLLSGNNMYWQVRLDEANNQMICYKYDAFYNDPVSTTNVLLTTGRWEQDLLKYNPINSIGAIYYSLGGFSKPNPLGFGGYKIEKPDSPLFAGLNYKFEDILHFNAIEYDGANITFTNHPTIPNKQIVVYDNSVTKFYKVAILAYDLAVPDWGGAAVHNGTLLAIRKKETAGLIINMAASNWCNQLENPDIKIITANAIDELLQPASIQDKLFL